MNSNVEWSEKIVEQIFNEGVRDIIVCAGARNCSLVMVLARSTGIRIHSFFEERSASFYALGLSRRTRLPVAVLTTSGTAVAELLPAVIEAFHTGDPLLVISADRPRRLRGTGAPQAIDQAGLFTKFVGAEFDLEIGEAFDLAGWNRRTPAHLNLCFDEPLLDRPARALKLSDQNNFSLLKTPLPFRNEVSPDWAGVRLTKFLRGSGGLAVVVGTLNTDSERTAVTEFLSRLRAPVYLEATSGLRESQELSGLALRSGDKILSWALSEKLISRVIRIGGVPTARIWRDLDDPLSRVEVLSLTSLPFAGLSRGELLCSSIEAALRKTSLEKAEPLSRLVEKDREGASLLAQLLDAEPESEPGQIQRLARLIPEGAFVYLGNSLPIREWDLAAPFDHAHAPQANRGVNGIDGQLSTFFGGARPESENWALVGDLTALYDLTSPWCLRTREDALTVRLVIMNNGGGKIFDRLFGNPLFENAHALHFENWAAMWNLNYRKWNRVPESFSGSPREVIELVPDAEATTRFWRRYDEFWSRPVGC